MPSILRPPPPGRLHRTRAFEIPGLPGRYPLTLWLPPNYERETKRYPVAYMFDGQNLFGDAGSFSGGWHLHEALDERARKGKTVPIVVGIHHGGASRMEELSPWAIGRGSHGRGDALLAWITHGLAQMIREDVRVLEGPEHTMLGGSSLGGLMTVYGFSQHPQFFGSCLAMSPALWVKRAAIFQVAERAPVGRASRVYIDCGGREGHVFQLAEGMAHLFARKGVENVMWRPDKRGSHNERNWRRRLPKALRHLYG
ncbi:MAG: uncharacterized protein JWM80_4488 [Cyanobacteria bacterium RYN_339]|nr:uncharacterized protein [Cyanobacteria bacterium RYN_339]